MAGALDGMARTKGVPRSSNSTRRRQDEIGFVLDVSTVRGVQLSNSTPSLPRSRDPSADDDPTMLVLELEEASVEVDGIRKGANEKAGAWRLQPRGSLALASS